MQPRTTKARTHEEFTPVVFHSSRRGPQCTRYVDPSKTVTRFAGSISGLHRVAPRVPFHGFADSPVAIRHRSLRGLIFFVTPTSDRSYACALLQSIRNSRLLIL